MRSIDATRNRRWLAAGVVAVAAMVAACGGNGDDAEFADGFSVSAALDEIPAAALEDVERTVQVVAADVVAAAEQAGLDRPADTSDRDALFAFLGPLVGQGGGAEAAPVYVPFPRRLVDQAVIEVDEFVDELGFSPGDVESFVALESPPAEFLVLTGVSVRDDLPEVSDGVATVGEGADFMVDVGAASAARPLGRALRVASDGSTIAMSVATPPLEEWVAGSPGGTLADDPVYGGLADRLDEEEVVSAFLVAGGFDSASGVGLGWLAAGAEAQGVIVVSYGSEELAEAGLGLVEVGLSGTSVRTGEPIGDLMAVESVEVRGTDVVVTFTFPDDRGPRFMLALLAERDGPFAEI